KMGIADKNGDIKYTDGKSANIKERDYFINALAGTTNVSDPIVSKVDGSIVVVVATPIMNNNEVVGVLVSTRSGNELSALTDKIKIGKTGYAYMIKKDGTIIAHSNKDLVLGMYNANEESKKDSSLEALANIQKNMGEGKKGTGECIISEIDSYVGYAPVEGTDWSLA
ncbi:cache domain-containing protein, partial [Cutibacterium acnes]